MVAHINQAPLWPARNVFTLEISDSGVPRAPDHLFLRDEQSAEEIELVCAQRVFVVAQVRGPGSHCLRLFDEAHHPLAETTLRSSGARVYFQCGAVASEWPPPASACCDNGVGRSLAAWRTQRGDKASKKRLLQWCINDAYAFFAGSLFEADSRLAAKLACRRVQRHSLATYDPDRGAWPKYFNRVLTSISSTLRKQRPEPLPVGGGGFGAISARRGQQARRASHAGLCHWAGSPVRYGASSSEPLVC